MGLRASERIKPYEMGCVTDEERWAENSVSTKAKWAHFAWGFVFGLVLGIFFGGLPLLWLHEQRKKFYKRGWGIGGLIWLILLIVAVVLARKNRSLITPIN